MLCCPLHILTESSLPHLLPPLSSSIFSTAEQIKADKHYTLSRSPILASRLKGVALSVFSCSFCHYY
ncbi:hypothetical protein NC653_025698 [Populus alba x Populus x berolinensis]|uniref:Uncharacterized protein n=1 Tax=Populus alba x Populus x berolinensis TaxID=444605 RepID=A0AAD6MCS0_9ROSI|nr:hypothetical protein NC653_025698 [Populus alba x Populus x berolinensis]